MALFEGYERRVDKVTSVLKQYGINSIEEARKVVEDKGVDVYNIVKGVQPICFEKTVLLQLIKGIPAIISLKRNW